MLDALVPTVAGELREYAEGSTVDDQIRLRMAVHHGFLDRTGDRWSGQTLIHAARLVDASAAKELLRLTDSACLAVMVSNHLYQSVIRDGYTAAGRTTSPGFGSASRKPPVDAWIQLR